MIAVAMDARDTEPLTRNQLGRIMGEWDRLGLYSPKYHRAERLRLTGILAHYPGELETTKDLTRGEAGRVVGLLLGFGALRDVYAFTEPEPKPEPVSPLKALGEFIATLSRISNQ